MSEAHAAAPSLNFHELYSTLNKQDVLAIISRIQTTIQARQDESIRSRTDPGIELMALITVNANNQTCVQQKNSERVIPIASSSESTMVSLPDVLSCYQIFRGEIQTSHAMPDEDLSPAAIAFQRHIGEEQEAPAHSTTSARSATASPSPRIYEVLDQANTVWVNFNRHTEDLQAQINALFAQHNMIRSFDPIMIAARAYAAVAIDNPTATIVHQYLTYTRVHLAKRLAEISPLQDVQIPFTQLAQKMNTVAKLCHHIIMQLQSSLNVSGNGDYPDDKLTRLFPDLIRALITARKNINTDDSGCTFTMNPGAICIYTGSEELPFYVTIQRVLGTGQIFYQRYSPQTSAPSQGDGAVAAPDSIRGLRFQPDYALTDNAMAAYIRVLALLAQTPAYKTITHIITTRIDEIIDTDPQKVITNAHTILAEAQQELATDNDRAAGSYLFKPAQIKPLALLSATVRNALSLLATCTTDTMNKQRRQLACLRVTKEENAQLTEDMQNLTSTVRTLERDRQDLNQTVRHLREEHQALQQQHEGELSALNTTILDLHRLNESMTTSRTGPGLFAHDSTRVSHAQPFEKAMSRMFSQTAIRNITHVVQTLAFIVPNLPSQQARERTIIACIATMNELIYGTIMPFTGKAQQLTHPGVIKHYAQRTDDLERINPKALACIFLILLTPKGTSPWASSIARSDKAGTTLENYAKRYREACSSAFPIPDDLISNPEYLQLLQQLFLQTTSSRVSFAPEHLIKSPDSASTKQANGL